MKTPEGFRFFRISVSGGQGGHSGVDINKSRLNAIKLICQFIYAYKYIPHRNEEELKSTQVAPYQEELYLSEINGGSANASIPGECTAVIGVPESDAQEFIEQYEWRKARMERMFELCEPNMTINIEEVKAPETIIK